MNDNSFVDANEKLVKELRNESAFDRCRFNNT